MAGQQFIARSLRKNWVARTAQADHNTAVPDVSITRSTTVRVYIDISEFTGTSVTFTLYSVDPNSGNETSMLASAAKTGTGTFIMTIGPGVATVSNVALSDIAPRTLRLKTTGTITTVSWTAAVELIG